MLEPLQQPFMQRALAEVVLIGVAGGALGCWVVHYGFAYAAESLAHSLFPGLVVAAIAARTSPGKMEWASDSAA